MFSTTLRYGVLSQVVSVAPDNPYLLENLEAAYSLKKRIATATASFRVRRGSDDAETDVLFNPTTFIVDGLNATVSAGGTLGDWIGSNDGFIAIDYDQTGNGYNMTAPNNAAQPKIISTGSWLGYKLYDAIDDGLFATQACTDQLGSAYIKCNYTGSVTYYMLNQAKTTDGCMITLTTDNSSNIRTLNFCPTNNVFGGNILSGDRILSYKTNGTNGNLSMGIDGVRSNYGSYTGKWFGDYSGAGFVLQKGAIDWSSMLYNPHREYETLLFNVYHTDQESDDVEATM